MNFLSILEKTTCFVRSYIKAICAKQNRKYWNSGYPSEKQGSNTKNYILNNSLDLMRLMKVVFFWCDIDRLVATKIKNVW